MTSIKIKYLLLKIYIYMEPFLTSNNNDTITLHQGIKYKNKKLRENLISSYNLNSQHKSNHKPSLKNGKNKEGFTNNDNDLGTRSKQAISKTNQLLSNADIVNSQVQELADLQTQFNSLSEQYNSSNTSLMNSTSNYVDETNTATHGILNKNKNVYVNKILNKPPTDTYIGCYTDQAERAINGTTTITGQYIGYDKCKQSAIDNGFQYFGLQNGEQCFVGNDETATKQYGLANKTNLIKLWESKTSGEGNYLFINPDGRFLVLDPNGNIKFQSENSPDSCWWGGNVNPDSLNATYGGNCEAPAGNATEKIKQLIIEQQQSLGSKDNGTYSFAASNQIFGDTAPGCVKNLSVSYQCGNVSKTRQESEGNYLSIDCAESNKTCYSSKLYLRPYGCIEWFGGPGLSLLWSSPTPLALPLSKNPNWEVSKNKYGRDSLIVGQTLMKNEWISSGWGECQLIMQEDGNLVLYTSTQTSGCSINDTNKKMNGGPWANAVYKLDQVGDASFMNKTGYVDENSILTEYPANMVSTPLITDTICKFDTNDYLKGYPDVKANDMDAKVHYKQYGLEEGRSPCGNVNIDCKFDPEVYYSLNPDVKANNMDAKDHYLRFGIEEGRSVCVTHNSSTPTVNNNSSCSKNVVNIDSLQWKNYQKNTEMMTPETVCGLKKTIAPEFNTTEELRQRLGDVADKIINKISQLSTLNDDMYKQMGIDKNVLGENLNKYKELSKSYHNYKNSELRNIDGIVKDSNVVVLFKNYNYILWSILAIVILIITIKNFF